jgi:hypothetical protein
MVFEQIIDFDEQLTSFDNSVYNFRPLLEQVFECEDLENIHLTHTHLIPDSDTLSKPWPYNENTSNFHSIFYKKLNEPWEEIIDLYERFIDNCVSDLVGERFLYQKFPTFRVHLPNLKAVTKWHYDADRDHRHPLGEINFILPITDMFETNTIWCETAPNRHDYKPIEAAHNQFIKFNGNRRHHGNKENKTSQTRFSFDFRILPIEHTPARGLFPEIFGSSATKNKKWEAGGYYNMYRREA